MDDRCASGDHNWYLAGENATEWVCMRGCGARTSAIISRPEPTP